tara:strand:- start:453 stop:575 length:123 start_codon:yes stop_codon:yes gene_type:complete
MNEMFIFKIIGLISIYLIGIVTGIYLASQIEKDINKRIKK